MHILSSILFNLGFPFLLVPTLITTLAEQGPAVACQYLVLLACVIGMEAYTLHRMIKVPCTLAVPRMIIINLIEALLQCIVGTLMVLAFQFAYALKFQTFSVFWNTTITELYLQTVSEQMIMPLALLGVIVGCILFIVRVLTAYKVYQLFDKKVDRKLLKKAVLRANIISYSFLMLITLATLPAVIQLFV